MNRIDERRLSRHARRVTAWLHANTAVLLLPLTLHATSAQAGAIVVGRGPDCTVPTIREAIQRANGFGGYNLILVTDEVPDGVHHENLLLQNLREDLVLELVGGYADCTTLAPTAFGKASLYGGDVNRPTLRLRGHNVATFRNFWMQSGTGEGSYGGGGIDFQGYGSLVLENVRVAESNALGVFGSGIHVDGQNGLAILQLVGGVEVTDQTTATGGGAGIHAEGRSFLRIRGVGNSIRNNGSAGITLDSPAFAHVGTSGTLIQANGGAGLAVSGYQADALSPTLIYSVDPADPVRISGNVGAVAIYAYDSPATSRVCMRNVVIEGNNGNSYEAPLHIHGRQAALDINPDSNDTCGFPPEADIVCPIDGSCNLINGNTARQDYPLISATRDASITLNRVLFASNRATSLLSTNLGRPASTASITMSNSLALYNTLRDNLFEALNGGIVDIRDSTIARNDGGFSVSLVGSDPTLFQVTDSIIDQPQALVYLSNGPIETTHFNHVLAHNRSGAQPVDNIVLGQPTYRDAYGRLAPDSPGVDYAPAAGGVDFDGNPRDVDTANLPNQFGPRDLGAFESQVTALEAIFVDGFDVQSPVHRQRAGG